MEFQVCRRGRDARWIVRLGSAVYGSYLDKEQALLDAIDEIGKIFWETKA